MAYIVGLSIYTRDKTGKAISRDSFLPKGKFEDLEDAKKFASEFGYEVYIEHGGRVN